MRVLLVEDEDPKLRHVESRLRVELPGADIDVCRSVNSATDYLDHTVPDLILLDMSLPTFDVSEREGVAGRRDLVVSRCCDILRSTTWNARSS